MVFGLPGADEKMRRPLEPYVLVVVAPAASTSVVVRVPGLKLSTERSPLTVVVTVPVTT